MTTVPGELHYSSRAHHEKKDLTYSHRRGPQIPDFRFEYSYLRSIRPYVHVERLEPTRSPAEDGKGESGAGSDRETAVLREIIEINWGRLLWITMRDQLLSPFAQGAVWCVLLPRVLRAWRTCLRRAYRYVYRGVVLHHLKLLWSGPGQRVRAWWARGGTSDTRRRVEGHGVSWLRNWVSSVTTQNTHPSTIVPKLNPAL